jgi:8-oxo-dGTP pyrophosphatase MutT (NUDIX family)
VKRRLRAAPFLLLCLVIAVACAPAKKAVEYDAAGIIAYTRLQGKTLVLLADHRDSDRGWGTFGGHQEEGETLAVTAAREFREETRCVYGHPTPAELEGAPFVAQRNFLSYVLEIPYVSAQVFEGRVPPDDCRSEPFIERGPFAWVPLDEIQRALDAGSVAGVYTLSREYLPAATSTPTLWDESATILQRAIEQGYLE